MVKRKVPGSDKNWPEFVDLWPGQHDELLLDPPKTREVMDADWLAVQGKQEPLGPLQRMGPKALREFVEGVLANRYFLSVQSTPSLATRIFLPITLGGLKDWEAEDLRKIGIVYAEYGKHQAPVGINGFPMFFSCNIMHKDDWALADAAIRKALKAQGAALDELENCETETG